jgi:hypothetical protein
VVKRFLEPLSGHLSGRVVITLPATRFSIQIFHVLPTQCIYAFYMRLGIQPGGWIVWSL